MKEVTLTRGKVALVDDGDFDQVSQFNWHAIESGKTWYARRTHPIGCRTYVYTLMHRQLTGAPDDFEVDHEDGDGLNNQRCNLRQATSQQNKRNRTRKTPGTSSRFKGVILHKGRWRAIIRAGVLLPNGKRKHIWLGGYETEEGAARAYDAAAIIHFHEFASLNFPISEFVSVFEPPPKREVP